MSACDLANTGMPVGALVAIALFFVLAGVATVVVFRASAGRARAGGALVLLIVVAGVLGIAGGGGSEANAAPVAASAAPVVASAAASAGDCPPGGGATGGDSGGEGGGGVSENSLTIIQTSVNTGLAPGVAPSELVGEITNHGTASAPIERVTVSIDAVTKAPDAAAGTCDASDYVLADTAMPVGVTLAPEQTAQFRGASIGFSDKSTNQDACKGATLHLRYTSS